MAEISEGNRVLVLNEDGDSVVSVADLEYQKAEKQYSQAIISLETMKVKACGYLDLVSKLISIGAPKSMWGNVWRECLYILGEDGDERSGMLCNTARLIEDTQNYLNQLKHDRAEQQRTTESPQPS